MEVGRLIVLLVMTTIASLGIMPARRIDANPAISSNMIEFMQADQNRPRL